MRANDAATLGTYNAALKDPEAKVRLAAAKALLSIAWEADGVITNLQACLEDASPSVREAAKEVLDRIQPISR